MQTRKLVATATAVATLAVGGLVVAAVNPFTSVGAAPTSTTAPTPAPSASSGSASSGPAGAAVKGQRLRKALAPLVTDGTITQAQADAVVAQLEKVAASHVRPGGPAAGRLQRLIGRRKAIVAAAAKAIGVTPADLAKALRAGQSIADVATAHHVAVSTVTTALVGDAKAAVEKAVTAGKLTSAQATKLEARLPAMIDRLVQAHRR